MFISLFKRIKEEKKYFLPYFCTSIVSHCNLNCSYCDHFAPLAKNVFFPSKNFKSTSKRLIRNLLFKQ